MITSATNPRIKEARKLQRRRYRHATGRMLIEGVRLVEDAIAAGVRPQLVFFAPELLTGTAGQKLVEQLARTGIETLACSSGVFATLTETVTPQGIAAVIPLPQLALPTRPHLTVILDRVREPGNAGALLRSAEAAGVALVLLAPETVDPYNDKAIRAGMGAHFRLPLYACPDWATVRARVGAGNLVENEETKDGMGSEPVFYMADAGASLAYDAVDWTQPAALIIGGEARGASPDAHESAIGIAIPMLGGTESLNAAIAGSVILFEAARQRRLAKDGR